MIYKGFTFKRTKRQLAILSRVSRQIRYELFENPRVYALLKSVNYRRQFPSQRRRIGSETGVYAHYITRRKRRCRDNPPERRPVP